MKNKLPVVIFIDTIKNHKFITISNTKNYSLKFINNIRFKTYLLDTSSQSHQFYTKDDKFKNTGKNIEKFMKKYLKIN